MNFSLKDNHNKMFIQEALVGFVYFAAITFYAVYLNKYLNINLPMVGTILFVLNLTARSSRVLLSDFITSFSINQTLFLFQFIGAVGYFIFYEFSNIWLIFLGAFFIGLFYSNNLILFRTFFLYSSKDEAITRVFAKISIYVNIGAALSPLIFNVIYNIKPNYSFLFLAILLFINSLVCLFSLKSIHIPRQKGISLLFKNLKSKNMFCVGGVITSIWFLYSIGFFIAPALLSRNIENGDRYIWITAFIPAFYIIFASLPIINFIDKFQIKTHKAIILSCIIATLAYIILYYKLTLISLSIAILIFTTIEIVCLPMYAKINSKLSKETEKTFVLAFSAIFVGIGESLGSWLAMNILHYQEFIGNNIYILIIMIYCITMIFISVCLNKINYKKGIISK